MTDPPKDSFASLFEAETHGQTERRLPPIELGELCRAEVIQVGRDGVFVELLDHAPPGTPRPQAFMNATEFGSGSAAEPRLKPGDIVEARVVEIDARSGEVRLGRSIERPAGADELATAHAARVPVDGKVTGVNKGGLDVEVGGVRAFCPISQADRGFVADPQSLVGRTLRFLITELREGGKRVVLSRRAVLEQEAKAAAERLLAQLAPGSVVRGTVTAVRDFGAFVDLGGIEGLIANSELSHDRATKAADVLNAGDAVEVKVLEIRKGVADKRGEPSTKISLSLKALAADPWSEIDSLLPLDKVVRGTVSRLADFGAFVRLAPGLEGLLHISELGGKVTHPSALLQVGQTLDVVVRSLDRESKRIALVPAPEGLAVGSEAGAPQFVIGAIVSGRVDRVETYGVFVQIDGTSGRAGKGLIPNAELGTPRGADHRKLFPTGTPVSVKVLETGAGRLRLSIRAVEQDRERAEYDGYRESASSANMGTLGDLLKGGKTPAKPGKRK